MSFFSLAALSRPLLVGALLASLGALACSSRADEAGTSNASVVAANADADPCGVAAPSAPSETRLASLAPRVLPTDAAAEKADRLLAVARRASWTLVDFHVALHRCLSDAERDVVLRQANELVASGRPELKAKLDELEASLDAHARVDDVETRLAYVGSVAGDGKFFLFTLVVLLVKIVLAMLF